MTQIRDEAFKNFRNSLPPFYETIDNEIHDINGVPVNELLSALLGVQFLPFNNTKKYVEPVPAEIVKCPNMITTVGGETLRRTSSVGDCTALSSITSEEEENATMDDQVVEPIKLQQPIHSPTRKKKTKKFYRKRMFRKKSKSRAAAISSATNTTPSLPVTKINQEEQACGECSIITCPTAVETLELSVKETEEEISRLQIHLAHEKKMLADYCVNVPHEISLVDAHDSQDNSTWKKGPYSYIRTCDLDVIDGDWNDLNAPNGRHVLNELAEKAMSLVGDLHIWMPTNEAAKQNDRIVDSSSIEIALWEGRLGEVGFKSDLPCVKACGIINCIPDTLYSLVLDSSRVKEYNTMSISRTDEHVFASSLADGVTKVMRSLTKPPIVPKPIELLTILHSRKLNEDKGEGRGWLCVSRAVRGKADAEALSENHISGTEMLLGVNIIQELDAGDGVSRTKFTTVTKVFTPGVPLFLARRFGPKSSAQYICNIRNALA